MLTLFGPLSLVWPLFFAIGLTCLLGIFATRAGRLFEAFPSLSWTIFIQIPFVLVSSSFNTDIAQVQLIGILLVRGALLLGDCAAIRYVGAVSATTPGAATTVQTFAIAVLMLLVVCLPAYHVVVAGTLPILNLFSSHAKESETALSREAFGKFLEVPAIIKYALNWVLTLMAPILIAVLLHRRRLILASAAFVCVCTLSCQRHHNPC